MAGCAARKKLYFLSNFSNLELVDRELDLVDRERLCSCLMTLVRKHDEVHQRRQKGFELVVFVFAEAGVEKRFDPADDSRGGHGGLRGRFGKKLSGLFVEAPREIVQEFDTSPNRSSAGGPGLDHHRPRRIGLAD